MTFPRLYSSRPCSSPINVKNKTVTQAAHEYFVLFCQQLPISH
uniref:Uncharacterized protein n=1 Tax=Anguilla anguilla TaxID=7936 RepID=A0A0E9TWW2_ANGAN